MHVEVGHLHPNWRRRSAPRKAARQQFGGQKMSTDNRIRGQALQLTIELTRIQALDVPPQPIE